MAIVNWKNNPLVPSFLDEFLHKYGPEDFFGTPNILPATNIEETPEAFLIKMAVPGLSKEDIKVEIERNLLTVSYEKEVKEEEKVKNYTTKEYTYNAFKRTFTLPENVKGEEIIATTENGELLLTLPKMEFEITKPKKIKIS